MLQVKAETQAKTGTDSQIDPLDDIAVKPCHFDSSYRVDFFIIILCRSGPYSDITIVLLSKCCMRLPSVLSCVKISGLQAVIDDDEDYGSKYGSTTSEIAGSYPAAPLINQS